ncbi:MAG TPA: cell division protein FtsA [Gemmatimonadota bacterium]|nr:cell division protein FtsA [Gemmatimonadota bacterium]
MIGGASVVTGLDVGSTKTCAVILEAGPDGQGPDRVLGVGIARTEGVRSDAVTDLEATTRSIRESVREAELMAGLEVESAYVGLAGAHVDVGGSSGVVAIVGHEITADDVERVHEVGRAVVVPPDRELLHAIPQEYAVDGRGGIHAPVGMAGTRLEADVCIVTADSAACGDLRRAVDRAGYGVDELVLEPLASSVAVLSGSERDAGVALLEVGGARTDVAVFSGGKIRRLSSLRWGGQAITNDIVKGLGVPLEEAERLKREYGTAVTRMVGADERVEVPGPAPGTTRRVSRELLSHIIEQRLDEIFGLVWDDLEEAGLLDGLTSGIVLTGGTVSMPGAVELAQSAFNLPVRQGEPGAELTGLADAVRRPKFATAVGLALYGKMREGRRGGGVAVRTLTRVTEWLRDFF